VNNTLQVKVHSNYPFSVCFCPNDAFDLWCTPLIETGNCCASHSYQSKRRQIINFNSYNYYSYIIVFSTVVLGINIYQGADHVGSETRLSIITLLRFMSPRITFSCPSIEPIVVPQPQPQVVTTLNGKTKVVIATFLQTVLFAQLGVN
jgi:hypothetical protein